MRIVILGAGQVGSSVAENLVSEANDITVVDTDAGRLRKLQDRLDLRTVVGNAGHPAILERAGARDADMLLAVTQSDETNLVACKLAATMFNIPTKIARIRATDYLSHPEMFTPENFAVDTVICPEQVLTDYIAKLIEFPESLQVLEFAEGRVSLVAVRAFHGGPLVGKELQTIRKHLPNLDTRVAAIFRQDSPIIPDATTVIEVGDEVFFIAATEDIRGVMRELRRMDKPVKRVMIGGGGNIGRRLAKAIEDRYDVKIIEFNKRGAENLAAALSKTLVLVGDVTDEDLIAEEDVVVTITSGGYAKRTRADLEISPNLWAGVGLVRGGAGTALVGNPQQVAERIREYADLGLEYFVLSGYPHLEEAYRFAELVFPLLPLEVQKKLGGTVLTGPFGEIVANTYVPKVSQS